MSTTINRNSKNMTAGAHRAGNRAMLRAVGFTDAAAAHIPYLHTLWLHIDVAPCDVAAAHMPYLHNFKTAQ